MKALAGCLALGLAALASAAESHDDSFSKDGLFKADAAALADTTLAPGLEAPLVPSRNLLWCGTLPLAWNEAVALRGARIELEPPSAAAEELNLAEFSRDDLDPSSYVAVADFERNHVEAKIRAALERVFHGAASPELIPPVPADPLPQDFVAYSYLYKNLAFATPFDPRPFSFQGVPVEGFGFPRDGDEKLQAEVTLYDYQSPDDFIIAFETKSPGDQLILAKVAPGRTLGDTARTVLKRMSAATPEQPGADDYLSVPKLNFDLRRDFPELQGRVAPAPAAKIKGPLLIKKVQQLVRFQLNERGAILKSEAVIVAPGAANSPTFERPMVFDKPFLILLKRTSSVRPYFALWVGNPTLLVKDKSP